MLFVAVWMPMAKQQLRFSFALCPILLTWQDCKISCCFGSYSSSSVQVPRFFRNFAILLCSVPFRCGPCNCWGCSRLHQVKRHDSWSSFRLSSLHVLSWYHLVIWFLLFISFHLEIWSEFDSENGNEFLILHYPGRCCNFITTHECFRSSFLKMDAKRIRGILVILVAVLILIN